MVLCFQLVEVTFEKMQVWDQTTLQAHTESQQIHCCIFRVFSKNSWTFFGEPPDAHFPHRNFSTKERSLFFLAAGASSSGCQRGVKMRIYQETLQRADWLSSNFSSTKTFRGATKPRTLKEQVLAVKRITSTHVKRCTKNFCFSVFQCWVCSSFVSRRLVTRVVSLPKTCR